MKSKMVPAVLRLTVMGVVLLTSSRAFASTLFAIPINFTTFNGDIDIFVTSGSDTIGTITNTDSSFVRAFSISANDTTIVTIPESFEIATPGIINTSGAFKIESDEPIAGYLLNSNNPATFTNDIVHGWQ